MKKTVVKKNRQGENQMIIRKGNTWLLIIINSNIIDTENNKS